MSATIEFVPFRGTIHKFEGKDLQDLRSFQGVGEALEQTLERICIEQHYEELEQQQHQQRQRIHNPNTLDHYL